MVLSTRMLNLVQETSAIMEGHLLCASDPFSLDNPKGYLNFGIAENHLMEDWTVPFANQINKLNAEDLQYFEMSGIASFRSTVATFFENQLNLTQVDPNNLVILNGLSSVCECLSYSMFAPEDYLMIPTPYYPGFEFDFQKRFGVKFLPVHLDGKDNFRHDIKLFIDAYDNFDKKNKVKAILITHPHNPTGEVIDEVFLKEVVNFAKKRKLEIITDEIYALTNFRNKKHKSLMQFAGDYEEHIHFLYGLAKDFTLAGLKVGIFYSKNQELIKAMKLLSYFHCTSSLTQRFSERLLSNSVYVKEFVLENNKRLKNVRDHILDELPNLKIIDCESGIFFLLDFRKFLFENSFLAEKNFSKELLSKYKIFLTAGLDMGMNVPGYFRMCFAKAPDQVGEMINRLKLFV